jgi:hypothetical protein
MCNINGQMQEDNLAKIVSQGRFNIVTIFGINDDRHYLAYVFDKDKVDGPIHRVAIRETGLIQAANELTDKMEPSDEEIQKKHESK